MRPGLNQQLQGWESLFPYERRRLLGFLHGIESYSPAEWQSLTASLVQLEQRMGVAGWNFSEQQDTMENASHLARSEHSCGVAREGAERLSGGGGGGGKGFSPEPAIAAAGVDGAAAKPAG